MDKELKAILEGPQIPMAGRKGITGEIAGQIKISTNGLLTVIIDPIIDNSEITPHAAIMASIPTIPCMLENGKTSDTIFELSLLFMKLSRQLRDKSHEIRLEGR